MGAAGAVGALGVVGAEVEIAAASVEDGALVAGGVTPKVSRGSLRLTTGSEGLLDAGPVGSEHDASINTVSAAVMIQSGFRTSLTVLTVRSR